jgi:hypothetical protein
MTRFGNILTVGLTGMAMLLLLGACAGTGPKIVGNYDPATDFSQFKTFAFTQPLGADTCTQRRPDPIAAVIRLLTYILIPLP